MELHDKIFYTLLLIAIFFFIIIEIVMFSNMKLNINKEDSIQRKRNLRVNIIIFLILMILTPLLIPILWFFWGKRIIINYIVVFFTLSFAMSLSTQIWMYIKLQRMKFDESTRDIEN